MLLRLCRDDCEESHIAVAGPESDADRMDANVAEADGEGRVAVAEPTGVARKADKQHANSGVAMKRAHLVACHVSSIRLVELSVLRRWLPPAPLRGGLWITHDSLRCKT